MDKAEGDISLNILALRQDVKDDSQYEFARRELYSRLPLPAESPSIRVLELNPPDPELKEETPLSCRISVVRLEDSPRFHALSYVWGPKTPGCTIACSAPGFTTADLEITQNCQDALREIRSLFGEVTIWVDAICIDQSNGREIPGQISLMGDIYQRAELVYIWLGPGNKASTAAIRFLKTTAAVLRPLDISSLKVVGFQELPRNTAQGTGEFGRFLYGLCMVLYSRWMLTPGSDLLDLLNREWIHRAWTFQEILLANHPVIICGNATLDWEDLVYSVSAADVRFILSDDFRSGLEVKALGKSSLATWRSISKLWVNLPRPVKWNGHPVWKPLFGHGENFTMKEHLISIAKDRRYVYWLLGLFVVVGCIIGLVTRLYCTSNKAGPRNLITPILLASILALLLWASIYVVLRQVQLNDMFEDQEFGELDVLAAVTTALRERVATKAHDRAFALQGILEALDCPFIAADYIRPLQHTYQRLFQSLLLWNPYAVFMLCLAGSDTSAGNGPSWVPNFATTAQQPWLTSRYECVILGTAAHHLETIPHISEDKLTVRGQDEGEVFARAEFPECLHQSLQILVGLLLNCRIKTPPILLLGDPAASLFAILRGLHRFRSPITGKNALSRLPDGSSKQIRKAASRVLYDVFQFGEELKTFRKLYAQVVRVLEPCAGSDTPPETIISEVIQHVLKDEELLKFWTTIVYSIVEDNRCIFVLSSGLVGSGPMDMKTGDIVVSVEGVPTPMVLRPATGQGQPGEFKVIGPCLVDGLMDGEGFDAETLTNFILV